MRRRNAAQKQDYEKEEFIHTCGPPVLLSLQAADQAKISRFFEALKYRRSLGS
jgi:hypothetical protein